MKHLVWLPFLLITMVGCGTLAAFVDPTADTRSIVEGVRGDLAVVNDKLDAVEDAANSSPITGNKWVDLALLGATLYGGKKATVAAVNAERDKKYMGKA